MREASVGPPGRVILCPHGAGDAGAEGQLAPHQGQPIPHGSRQHGVHQLQPRPRGQPGTVEGTLGREGGDEVWVSPPPATPTHTLPTPVPSCRAPPSAGGKGPGPSQVPGVQGRGAGPRTQGHRPGGQPRTGTGTGVGTGGHEPGGSRRRRTGQTVRAAPPCPASGCPAAGPRTLGCRGAERRQGRVASRNGVGGQEKKRVDPVRLAPSRSPIHPPTQW